MRNGRPRASVLMADAVPQIVSASKLGKALGISGSRSRELAAAGCFVRVGRGYDLEASRASYMKSLRASAVGKRGPDKASGTDARQRLATAQAIAIETKNRIAARDLISEAEVEATWSEIVLRTRAAVLAAPERIHSDLPHLTAHDVQVIERVLRDALAGLAGSP